MLPPAMLTPKGTWSALERFRPDDDTLIYTVEIRGSRKRLEATQEQGARSTSVDSRVSRRRVRLRLRRRICREIAGAALTGQLESYTFLIDIRAALSTHRNT